MLANGLRKAGTALGGCAVALASPALRADWALNMPRGVTSLSRSAYDMHMLALWVTVAIGVLVFGVMLVSIILHRKARGHPPAQFRHSTRAEIVWTVIPVLILVAMVIPATRLLIAQEDTSRADLTIKVTGYQWKWEYEYPELGIRFFSSLASSSLAAIRADPTRVPNYLLEVDRRLVVPVGRKVRFLITAGDVIHSWWVPALGMKKDAVPGYITRMWARIEEPGVYRGQCAELCGAYHGFMPVVVDARVPEEFERWVAAQRQAARPGITTTVAAALPAGG